MEHQTPSVFPGNFRKRKVLGTLCFPFCLPEKLVQAKPPPPTDFCTLNTISRLGCCMHEGQPLGAVAVAAYGAAAVPATGGMLRLPATNE